MASLAFFQALYKSKIFKVVAYANKPLPSIPHVLIDQKVKHCECIQEKITFYVPEDHLMESIKQYQNIIDMYYVEPVNF
jgi:hypothetical protein